MPFDSSIEVVKNKAVLQPGDDLLLPPDSYAWVCAPKPAHQRQIDACIHTTQAFRDALNKVKKNGLSLEHFGKFASNTEIVHWAVRQNGLALAFADSDLCANHAILMTAVQNNGLALRYADPKLCSDAKVALAAVASNGCALEFVDPALRNPKHGISQIAVKNNIHAIAFVLPEDRHQKSIILAARQAMSSNQKIGLLSDEEFLAYLNDRYL